MRNALRILVVATTAAILTLPAIAQSMSFQPSYTLGATMFADFTYQDSPSATDANGKSYSPESFNVSRTYINFKGKLNDLVEFRITPDIYRDSNGDYLYRLKYAFAQFDLNNIHKGDWIRFGQQQTPWVDYEEGIYRYRFQGPIFVDREHYLTSSDIGVSGHFNFAHDYGDVHVGYYNGEGYSHPEANNQKGFEIRASFRPFPTSVVAKGLRFAVFYMGDDYQSGNQRNRTIANVTYQSDRLNGGFDYLDAKDQTSDAAPTVESNGYSFWINPRTSTGWELLYRHDELKPDKSTDMKKKRDIIGISYWLQGMKKVKTAFMFDYDNATYSNYPTAKPDETKYGVHMLLDF